MVYVLAFAVMALWIMALIVNKMDLLAPACIVCEMFLLASCLCVIYRKMYYVELHSITVIVIAFGLLVFIVVSGFFESVYARQKQTSREVHFIEVKNSVKCFFLFLQVIILMFHIKYVTDLVSAYGYGYANIFVAAGRYHDITVRDSIRVASLGVSMPIIYRLGGSFSAAYSYLAILGAVNNFHITRKWDKIWILSICLLAFETVLTGGRSSLFRVITAIVFLLIAFERKTRRISFKAIGKIIFAGGLVVIAFIYLNQLLSRSSTVTMTWIIRSVFEYLGAPIVNLDIYLQNPVHGNYLFGEQTFIRLYNILGNKLNNSDFIYSLRLPYNRIHGLNLGNVYTTFYQFIYDFGYGGIIFCLMPIALYFCRTYLSVIYKRENKMLNLAMYAYLLNDLVMLFFSNRFYECILTTEFLKLTIYMWMLYYLLFTKKIDFSLRVIKIKRAKSIL